MCDFVVSCHFRGSDGLCPMSSFLGRSSRRRRVLNEEALSASSAHLALHAGESDEPAEDAPRYSDAAGVEHHPQVTDYIPRKFRTLGMVGVAGIGTTAVIEGLYWFLAPRAEKYGFDAAAAFDLSSSSGVASWLASMVLAVASATCWLIYSLRRHRIDDFKGRYRIWLAAAVACALLSLESVAPVHRMLAAAAAYHTGWTALRGHAAWWLVLGGLPLGWIALRAWLDARESRAAAVAIGAAIGSYGVAVASYLGIGVELAPASQVMVTAGATLVGHWMLLVGILSYGRYVVLDAQGLIPARERSRTVSKREQVAKDREVKHASRTAAAESKSPLRSFRESYDSAEVESKSTQWVDGTEPVSENYDDEDGDYDSQKISKADRKRMRKQKRAA
jgi:hypothetical protein